jgi:hypothetical protein
MDKFTQHKAILFKVYSSGAHTAKKPKVGKDDNCRGDRTMFASRSLDPTLATLAARPEGAVLHVFWRSPSEVPILNLAGDLQEWGRRRGFGRISDNLGENGPPIILHAMLQPTASPGFMRKCRVYHSRLPTRSPWFTDVA